MQTTARLRAVLLDAGNTLIVERESRAALYAAAARARGLTVDDDAMLAHMKRAHAELPREIGAHFHYSEGWFACFIERVFVERLGLDRSALARVQAELLERFADPATFRVLPGAFELVRELRARGLVVGVVSNWSERLPDLLEGLGLARELDFIVVSALERCEKPEPRIFAVALERARVGAAQALHVGDDLEADVHGARALGILPIQLARDSSSSTGTHVRVRDLHELKRWILDRLET